MDIGSAGEQRAVERDLASLAGPVVHGTRSDLEDPRLRRTRRMSLTRAKLKQPPQPSILGTQPFDFGLQIDSHAGITRARGAVHDATVIRGRDHAGQPTYRIPVRTILASRPAADRAPQGGPGQPFSEPLHLLLVLKDASALLGLS